MASVQLIIFIILFTMKVCELNCKANMFLGGKKGKKVCNQYTAGHSAPLGGQFLPTSFSRKISSPTGQHLALLMATFCLW